MAASMTPTIRLRKSDFTTPAACATLALQQVHGASCRAYWIKRALVAAGWTVYYSSDGVTTGNSDLWTTSAFQAILMQGPAFSAGTTSTIDGAWCCLQSPYADVNGDYLHICLSPSQAQWYDPAVRGPDNSSTAYGVTAKTGASDWRSGYYTGFLRLGMTLSSSATAFSGGAPFVATTSATARGALPTATGAFWTTHNMGSATGTANPSSKALTVVTEGNQFHIISDCGTAYTVGSANWWGISTMANGGYAAFEQGVVYNATGAVGTVSGRGLHGGRIWSSYYNTGDVVYDTPTELGGWRSGYIKRDSGTLINGGLGRMEPCGFEAVVEQPYYSSGALYPSVVALQAISCTDSTHYNLGNLSDFIMLTGVTRVNDLDQVIDSGATKKWYAMRNSFSYLLKWDYTDTPATRTAVTPP